MGSSAQFAGVIAAGDKLLRQCILLKVPPVISLLDQLDGLAVGPLVPLINSDNPALAGEGLSEVVQFEVLISGISVSHIVVTLGLAVSRVHLPSAVVAELVHQAVLHAGQHQVVNPVTVFRHVVLLVDVRVYATSDSHHPQKFIDIVA